MRFTGCVLLCLSCGLAWSESTQDYFSKAFGNAVPSPFQGGKSLSTQKKQSLDLKIDPLKLLGADGSSSQPLILSSEQARLLSPNQCAIPLLKAPIAEGRDSKMRVSPIGPSATMDRIGRSHIPVCKP